MLFLSYGKPITLCLFFPMINRISMLFFAYTVLKKKRTRKLSFTVNKRNVETRCTGAGKTGLPETTTAGKRSGKGEKRNEKRDCWAIPLQELWLLNRLNPESGNNNAGDNNNQRSQDHRVHNNSLHFPVS